ncbi:MAG: cell division protein FtsQ/DivIB [Pseudonocardiaceae bacterium]
MRSRDVGAPGARRRSRRGTPQPSPLTPERGTAQGRVAHGRAVTARGAAADAVAPSSPRSALTWWPWLVAGVGLLALIGGLIWVLLGSSLFGARAVQVVGTRELPADVVRAVAAVPLGTPMLRLDTEAIETRVAALPRVASVAVRCGMDGTVRVEVTERIPLALVRRGGDVHLVDATGFDYAVVPEAPPGLPELRVSRVGPRDATTMAALTVLTTLPDWLRIQVRSISARSPADVVLRLDTERDGGERQVRWGDASESDRKAAVLGPLLTQPGQIYDVSSPTLPTIA